MVNRAIDAARARTVRAEIRLGETVAAPTDPAAPDQGVLGALAALPPEQRAVVVLRYLLDYTPGEIARLLELPRGTVNSRLRRGLDAMRDNL